MTKTITIDLSKTKVDNLYSSVQVAIKTSLEIIGIPNDHHIICVARDVETPSKYYVVSQFYFRNSRTTAKSYQCLYVGEERRLVQANVKSVNRDNGSISIDYILNDISGTFSFPFHLNEAKPQDTYNGNSVELERLL